MWSTLGQVSGSCRYGTSTTALDHVATPAAPPVQYLQDATHHHTALMSPLKAGTRYYYRVGADGSGWSPVLSFTTEPADESAPFTMSIFGDLGYESSAKRPLRLPAVGGLARNWTAQVTRDWLEAHRNEFDMIWHLGDIGYADDGFASSPLAFAYEDIYDGWMDWMQSLSGSKAYMVSPGNHEAECHSASCGAFVAHTAKGKTLSNFTAYNARWAMPYEESGSRSNMWYSFDYGSMHVVSLSSETDFEGNRGGGGRFYDAGGFGPNNEQMKWLAVDLEAAQEERLRKGSKMKWIIVGAHRPTSQLSQAHRDLFEKYDVNIYFAGHSHSYTRSSPVNGTTLVVVGGAGCDEMPQVEKNSDSEVPGDLAALDVDGLQQGPWWQEGFNAPVGTEEYSTNRYATGLLSVSQESLHWKLYDSEDGEVLDQFVIQSEPIL